MTQYIRYPSGSDGSGSSVKTQGVFVDYVNGSDVTGTGTLSNPYKTYTHALSTITDASSSKYYAIYLMPGTYIETSFVIEPWISIIGAGTESTSVSVESGSVTLGINWASEFSLVNIQGITFGLGTFFDLDPSSLPNANATVYIDEILVNTAYFGGATTGSWVYDIRDSEFGTVVVNSCSVRDLGSIYDNSLTVHDDYTAASYLCIGCDQNTVDLAATNNHGITGHFYAGTPIVILEASGVNTVLYVDAISYVAPTLSASATFNLSTLSDGILANYTPVNYTAVNDAVQGHLHGIDDAIGTLGSNSVAFAVHQNTQQTIPNNSLTKVNWDTKDFDVGNYFSTATSRYTPLAPGEYLFIAQPAWVTPSSSANVSFEIRKNGIAIANNLLTAIGNTSVTNIPALPVIVSMNGINDYVDVAAYVSGNGGASLGLANSVPNLYFTGALLDQKASIITPSTLLNTIYYSKQGSDTSGNGTIDFPFATPNYALTYALTLSPTASNPISIFGMSGTYTISSTGALIYPNINWLGNYDVTWTSSTITSITLAPNASWSSSQAYVIINGINIDSTMTLFLDSTGYTNFLVNFYIENFSTQQSTTFTVGSSSHTAYFYLNDNIDLAQGASQNTNFNSVNVYARGGHTFSNDGGHVNLTANNNNCVLLSTGNNGMGLVSLTSGTTYNITTTLCAGKSVNFSSINASGAGGLTINVDSTTYMGNFPAITGGHYFYQNISFYNENYAFALTDGATVNWNTLLYPSASWVIGGSSHTLTPTSGMVTGALYQLILRQNSVGGFNPLFSSAITFPTGQPFVNLAANAYTTYLFYCVDGTNLICLNSRVLETSLITACGSGAGSTHLTSASTNNATLYGVSAGASLPSAPTNPSFATFIGYGAGQSYSTSGNANDGHVGVGYAALSTTTTSYGNTAIGFTALELLTSSSNNTAVGWGAGIQLTSGTGQNCLFGVFAGSGGTGQTIANNVMIGYHAGWNSTTAAQNVVIGSSSGATLNTGTNNVVIGHSSDVSASNASNQIVIGEGVTGLGNNTAVIGNSNLSTICTASTTGNCDLGSSTNPFGTLFMGSSTNYMVFNVSTQTSNGTNFTIPDAGTGSAEFTLQNITAATTSITMVKWFKYFSNSASRVVFTIPATFAQGDVFEVIGQGTGGWTINYGTGVSIKLNANLSTTVSTGYLQSTDQYDVIKLIAESSTVLVPEYVKGNLVMDTGTFFNSCNSNYPSSLVFVTTTTRTLQLSDAGSYLACANASAQVITVPTNASVTFGFGTKIDFVQRGAGQVSFTPAAGVTIESKAGNLKLAAEYSGATLIYLGSNVWSLIGDLTS